MTSAVWSTTATSSAFLPLPTMIVLESFPSTTIRSGGARLSSVFAVAAAPRIVAHMMANVSV